MGIIRKQVQQQGLGGMEEHTEFTKGAKIVFGGLAGILALAGINELAGDPTGISKSLFGKGSSQESTMPVYEGRVNAASRSYFSLEQDGLEYVLNDFNARELMRYDNILISGMPVSGNPAMIIVNRIDVPDSADPIYRRFFPVYTADTSTPDDLVEYRGLRNLKHNEKDTWEKAGELVRIIGTISQDKNFVNVIENDNIVGKVLLREIPDYVKFRLEQSPADEHINFYLKRKDTVEWDKRKETKELFYADLGWISKLNHN